MQFLLVICVEQSSHQTQIPTAPRRYLLRCMATSEPFSFAPAAPINMCFSVLPKWDTQCLHAKDMEERRSGFIEESCERAFEALGRTGFGQHLESPYDIADYQNRLPIFIVIACSPFPKSLEVCNHVQLHDVEESIVVVGIPP